jgi:hypothetical protein
MISPYPARYWIPIPLGILSGIALIFGWSI